MDPRHLQQLIALENRYWWHVAKRELVIERLAQFFPPPCRLIEGGIGAGANLVAFKQLGYDVTGFDVSPESVRHCQSLGLHNVQVHDLEMCWPVDRGSARVVVLLDVLEHLADPVLALRHAAEALEPGGGIVVTVPAGPMLMGPWDRMLGHRRRYTRRMLREQVMLAGLKPVWLSFWNSFTLPAAVVVRLLEKLRNRARSADFPIVRPMVNTLLIRLARLERLWMRRRPVPCGLSLVGVLSR